ncbi:MAG: hypothetical protein HY080_15840 [Gammaproteobacteria bacterium]|nr:hypothetical protein [Gammaproteobacteria bacterium]
MNLDLSSIKQTVQKNCHIADANTASDYTLCIYLMKMREYYRWEHGFNYGDNLPNHAVGEWLRNREKLWQALEEEQFAPIRIDDHSHDPFDCTAINAALQPHHLIYSGGFGYNVKPHFFLGVLETHEQHQGYDIYVAGDEYACDLTSPPAMSQGKTIYLRRDALRRMLWEKYEQWLWNKPDNALGRALAEYDFSTDVDQALDKMTHSELKAALWHEIGEVMAHHRFGGAWEELLLKTPRSKLEVMLRAIRDLYADCISTLPQILALQQPGSLHFFLANLTPMRKHLFPGLVSAYDTWHRCADRGPLNAIAEEGAEHWGKLCHDVLAYAQDNPESFNQALVSMIEQHRL